MFCPPGMQHKIRERRQNRRNRRQQRKARQEAVAAGWNNNIYEDDSSDESLENEHNLWTTTSLDDYPAFQTEQPPDPELPMRKQQQPESEEKHPSGNDSVVDIQVKSFSTLQVFSAEYFDTKQEHPILHATSGSSAAEEDGSGEILQTKSSQMDDEEYEDAIDDTALENKEELHAILNELQSKSLATKANQNTSDSTGQDAAATTDMTETTESETEATLESVVVTEATPAVASVNDGSAKASITELVSDESSDDEGSDDEDSLDLGVISSVWPSKGAEKSADLAPTSSVQRQFMESTVSALSSTTIGRGAVFTEATEDEQSMDGSLEEEHEGAEVFMFTEGVRYSGLQNEETANKLLRFQDPANIPPGDAPSGNESRSTMAAMLLQGVADYQHPSQQFDTTGLPFSPRFYSDEDDSEKWEDLKLGSLSSKNSVRSLEGSTKSIHTNRSAASASAMDPLTSPLSSMIAPVDLSLFEDCSLPDERTDLNESFASFASDSVASFHSVASCPVRAEASSILRQAKYAMNDICLSKNRRSRLSSSFKSSTRDGRVAYSLSRGKRSMNKSQRAKSKDFLPRTFLSHDAAGTPRRKSSKDRALSVLLVEMSQQIFEVLEVDIHHDTTIGDVLSKARSAATDPSLSEQKYLSLVCGSKEFAAPMLPVSLILDDKHKSRPLVVAVPEGSTGSEMRSVKRVLFKNPKTKRWWNQEDPFMPKVKEEVRPDLPIPECVEVDSPRKSKFDSKEKAKEPETNPVSSVLDENINEAVPTNQQESSDRMGPKKISFVQLEL